QYLTFWPALPIKPSKRAKIEHILTGCDFQGIVKSDVAHWCRTGIATAPGDVRFRGKADMLRRLSVSFIARRRNRQTRYSAPRAYRPEASSRRKQIFFDPA